MSTNRPRGTAGFSRVSEKLHTPRFCQGFHTFSWLRKMKAFKYCLQPPSILLSHNHRIDCVENDHLWRLLCYSFRWFTWCKWSMACCWAFCPTGTSWSPPRHPSAPSEPWWCRWGSERPPAGTRSLQGQSSESPGRQSKGWPAGETAQRGSWGWRVGGCIWWSWWRCRGSTCWVASPFPGPRKAGWTSNCVAPFPLFSDHWGSPSAGPGGFSTSWQLCLFLFLSPSCPCHPLYNLSAPLYYTGSSQSRCL